MVLLVSVRSKKIILSRYCSSRPIICNFSHSMYSSLFLIFFEEKHIYLVEFLQLLNQLKLIGSKAISEEFKVLLLPFSLAYNTLYLSTMAAFRTRGSKEELWQDVAFNFVARFKMIRTKKKNKFYFWFRNPKLSELQDLRWKKIKNPDEQQFEESAGKEFIRLGDTSSVRSPLIFVYPQKRKFFFNRI